MLHFLTRLEEVKMEDRAKRTILLLHSIDLLITTSWSVFVIVKRSIIYRNGKLLLRKITADLEPFYSSEAQIKRNVG